MMRYTLQVGLLLIQMCAFICEISGQDPSNAESLKRPAGISVGKLSKVGDRWEAKDELTANDKIGSPSVGAYCKVYSLTLKKDEEVQIDLVSKDFDAYLYLLDKTFKVLASNDDGGGGTNSRMRFRARETGVYQVLATSLLKGKTGSYLLAVRDANQHWHAVTKAEGDGKLDVALEAARKALAVDRGLFPWEKSKLVTGLERVARLHELHRSWDEARKLRQEVVAIREKSSGRDHWQTRDARNALSLTDTLAGLTPDQLNLVKVAADKHDDGIARSQEKKYREAADLFQQALARREKVFGQDHLMTASSAAMLGESLVELGEIETAMKHLEQTLVVFRKALGDLHPNTANVMGVTAKAHEARNESAKAVAIYEQILAFQSRSGSGSNSQVREETLRKLAVAARAGKDFRAASSARERLLSAREPNGQLDLDYWERFKEVQTAHKAERDAVRQSAPESKARLSEVAERQDRFFRGMTAHARSSRDYSSASRIESAIMDLWREIHDDKHWRVLEAKANRNRWSKFEKLTSSEQRVIEEIYSGEESGTTFLSLEELRGSLAIPKTLAELKSREQLVGKDDPDYAQSLSKLGMIYQTVGRNKEARSLLTQALELRLRHLGADHPQTAISLNQLGQLHYNEGEYSRAIICLRRAHAILEQQIDHRHPAYRAALNNLAVVYQRTGDHTRASELLSQAYDAFLKHERTKFADDWHLLGLYACIAGDANWSGNLYLRFHGMGPQFKLPNSGKSEQALLLNNLARADMAAGNLSDAIRRLNEARDIYEDLAGDSKSDSPRRDHAVCLNNLGLAYILQKEFTKAQPLLERSLILRSKEFGEARPEYATGLTGLAFLHAAEGRHKEARPLLQRAADILKQNPGEKSLAYANLLGNLTLIDSAEQRPADALKRLELVLEVCVDQLRSSATVQSEREQLARLQELRGHLDAFLAVALRAKHDSNKTYAPVLTWKGSVFARQRRIRERQLLSGPGQAEADLLLTTLEEVTREIGQKSQSQTNYPTPDGQKKLVALERRKEELEQQLAAASAVVRSRQQTEAMTPAKLQAALPKEAVLVDFLEFSPPTLDLHAKRERRLAAFVVHREGPVVALDLGSIDPIAGAVDRWRQTTNRRHPVRDESDPAAELRKRVWAPVAKHFRGAKLVFISPDGPLGKLPFAALPGKDRDTYVIEEFNLVTIPVPQELPRLSADAGRRRFADEPTLLLVGDVDFDAGIEKGTQGSGKWTRLAGTRGEMLAVRDTFEQKYPFPDGQVRVLREARATETLFREQASKHRWLHLATHGYFAPANRGSGLRDSGKRQTLSWDEGSGFHPGVLSGLVLAGANGPPPAGGDDGILTALEIAELNLNSVEVAVLSACQTGLGAEAGGEGLIGLQRAFQTAGVRTVVASLWSVDDQPTRHLMEDFYQNLWQKGLSPAEALRQAQLKMLKEGPPRGMVFEELDVDKGRVARVPPRYWAAFTISGGWDRVQEKLDKTGRKPMILRPRLVNTSDPDDEGLERLLEQNLREMSTSGGPGAEPSLVYVSTAKELPGAFRVNGSFTVNGDKITGRLTLKRDGKVVKTLPFEGATSKLPGLANDLVQRISVAAQR